jgi:diacylglycerol O-acyltransferase / wax synthase
MRRLHGADALFLYSETPAQHLHTLKIGIIDPTENPEGYSFEHEKEKLATRLHRVPPFRWRVVPTPLALHHPVWVESLVDLDFHVRRAAVPTPGGTRELCELVSEIASRPLDRSRPLWELWLVEGLEGGRIAAVSKIHHTLADGVASAELLNEFLTRTPDEEVLHAAPPWAPEPAPAWRQRLALGLRDLWQFLPRAIRELARAIRETRRREAAGHAEPLPAPPRPGTAPPTSLNGVLSAQRRFAIASLSLSDARAVRRAFGVTLNDVVVAMVAGALRAYLAPRGELPAVPLVATIPVSLRTPEDAGRYGNHTGAMYVALRSDLADPVERLEATRLATRAAKQHFEDTRGAQLADWLELFPPVVTQLVFSRLPTWLKQLGRPSQANVIISNVPGAGDCLYYGRSKLTDFFSVGPLLEGIGLNVTVWSYADRLELSLLACRDAVRDPWELISALRAEFEALVKAAPARSAGAARAGEAG